MTIPWAIIISLLLPIALFIIKDTCWHSMEEESDIKLFVGGFFVLYIAAAIGVYYLNPPLNEGANSVKFSTITNALSFDLGDNSL